MRTRKARPEDIQTISRLIEQYALQGLLLPRTEAEVRARLGCFQVLEDNSRLAGCAALESYGPDLAEIRSLAVDPEIRGRGLGSRLVQSLLAEARRRKIARVFAVTHAPHFFTRQGFRISSRRELPEKIERDCAGCPRSRECSLVAVVAMVCSEAATRRTLPVLHSVTSSLQPK